LPCTSKRGPQSEAHAGRVEENGTMSPSGDAVAPAAVAVVVWAFMKGMVEMRDNRKSEVG
jgi:hypothetical protein